MYIKRKLLKEGQGLTLPKALQIAENCEKVNTQLSAMSPEGQQLEEKEEDESRGKREVLGRRSSHLLKSTGIDVAEPGISAETQSVQQKVINVFSSKMLLPSDKISVITKINSQNLNNFTNSMVIKILL